MPDETLRALERAARARPDDVAAGWAYARALERAGDRRAFFAELCRLDRLGDVEAVDAVDGWSEAPGLRAPVVSVRALPIRVSDLELAAVVVERTPAGRLAVLAPGALGLIDPDEPGWVWQRRGIVDIQRRGDDLVVVAPDEVVVVDPDDDADRTLTRVGLPGPGAAEFTALRGDRLLIATTQQQLQAVDVGDGAGRVLWSVPGWRTPQTPLPSLAGEIALWVDPVMPRAEARDLADGRVLWRREPPGPSISTVNTWYGGDGRGVIVQQGPAGKDGHITLLELEPRSGAPRWSARLPLPARRVVTPSAVVVFGPDGAVALDRGDGRDRWRHAGTRAQRRGGVSVCVGAADDVVYFARVDVGHPLTLTALELSTGAARFEQRAEVSPQVAHLVMSVGPGCVDIVALVRNDSAQLVRFTDQPDST